MGEVAEQLIEYGGRAYGKTYRTKITQRHRGKRYKLKQFNKKQQVKGIMFFLYDKGITRPQDAHAMIRCYCNFAGIELPNKRSIIYACVEIQKNFGVFLKWFNERASNLRQAQ